MTTEAHDTDTMQEHAPDLYRYEVAAQGVQGFDSVGEAELSQFHNDGYLVINGAFTPSEVEAALEGITDLINGLRPEFEGVQFEPRLRDQVDQLTGQKRQDAVRKLFNFVAYDDRLKKLSEHPRLLDVIRQLMGSEPEMFQDMALLKPPMHGTEKPWHQDCAYFNLPPGATIVGVWIALHEARAENGCMHIIPGSHLEGPVVHFTKRDWQMCDGGVAVARDVMVPLKPGGCLLFHGLMHHGTPMNRSPLRRHALQFHYKPAGTPQTSLEERLAVFGSEGKNVTC